jgi:hypothetical protein
MCDSGMTKAGWNPLHDRTFAAGVIHPILVATTGVMKPGISGKLFDCSRPNLRSDKRRKIVSGLSPPPPLEQLQTLEPKQTRRPCR